LVAFNLSIVHQQVQCSSPVAEGDENAPNKIFKGFMLGGRFAPFEFDAVLCIGELPRAMGDIKKKQAM
jgi:hypothetical protein